jgi:hypothetical protein
MVRTRGCARPRAQRWPAPGRHLRRSRGARARHPSGTIWHPSGTYPNISGNQAWKVIIPAEQHEPDVRVHEGYEWLYVLSGRLRLVLTDHDLVLARGSRRVRRPAATLVRQHRERRRRDPQPVRPAGRAHARARQTPLPPDPGPLNPQRRETAGGHCRPRPGSDGYSAPVTTRAIPLALGRRQQHHHRSHSYSTQTLAAHLHPPLTSSLSAGLVEPPCLLGLVAWFDFDAAGSARVPAACLPWDGCSW